MQQYLDRIQTSQGAPIVGASITVNTLSGEIVTIFSDDGITQTANPLASDGSGEYTFYAPDGDYELTIEASGYAVSTKNIRLGLGGAAALTNAQLRAQPVPVSGTVAVSTAPTTAVTGNFYQATQPISGTVAVTGAYQATQPVSIASMPTTGVTGSFLTDTQLRATAVPVTGTVAASTTALTPAAPGAGTVGTSSAQVLASNVARKGAVFINLSANTISFGLGATAVLNSGITLLPYGTWTMDAGSTVTSAINAIASVASSVLGIQEFS